MLTFLQRSLHRLKEASHRHIIPIGLGSGLLLSLAVFYAVWRTEYNHLAANFYLDARIGAGAMQQALDYSMHDLAAARSLYLASAEVTRSEFAEFIADQLEATPLPGLIALEWVPYVPGEQRAAYEQAAQADGLAGFTFTERNSAGEAVRAGQRPAYYPVYYVAPQNGQEYAFGFDLGSDETRLAAMQQARDSGRPVIAGAAPLMRSSAQGALIFVPIYDNDVDLATVTDRRTHLRGFLLGVFDLHSMLAANRSATQTTAHDLYLLDPSRPPQEQLIFSSAAGDPAAAAEGAAAQDPVDLSRLQTGLRYEQEIDVADQTWLLIIKPAEQLVSLLSPLPLVAAFAALAFTLLATAYIARRRQAKEILRRSEEQYRLVAESVSDVIWSVDVASQQVRFITPSVFALRGLTPAEVLQQPIGEMFAPESWAVKEVLMPQRIAAVADGFVGPYVDEVALRRWDGSAVWTETTSHFVVDPQTGHLHLYGVSRDISERRRNERIQAAQFAVNRILAQSPQQHAAIVQVLEALTTGLDWLAAEFWQISADQSRLEWGAGWWATDHLAVAQFMQQSQTVTFARGQGLVGQSWQQNKALWYNGLDSHPEYPRHAIGKAAGLESAAAIPISIEDEPLGVMVFHDAAPHPFDDRLLATLTDLGRQIGQFLARKQAEMELESERASLARHVQERTADLSRANEELAHALRAKDEFLANMSHELRTPLNGILTLAESLQEGIYGSLPSRQQRAVALIGQSGHHLLALINDILDLAKVEAGKLDVQMERVSAFHVAQGSLALVQEMANRKPVQLAYACDDGRLEMQADGRRLKQILVNLLANAIKFTPSGGHVSLRVAADPAAKEIVFTVQDDGIGIAPEMQPKLFQPFTQLDAGLARSYEGTGLGLALVRRLVELHHGRVRVESTGVSGEGSRFIVALPWEDAVQVDNALPPESSAKRRESAPAPAALPAADDPAGAQTKARILVADDNELNLMALEDYLTSAGYQLFFANDGEQALQQAQAVSPHLILMDIQMPKMNGVEAIRRLRADPQFAAIPVLALTALAMPGDRELCLEAGANAYISKPFRMKDLVVTIEQWLAQPLDAVNS